MNKFQNKYRIPSHRKPGWDYSSNGMYFITLVTQNRECCLGNIHNGEMMFSDFGKIVYNEWVKSFEMRQELFIDQYTIMPNHLHAIIVINHDGGNDDGGTHENGTNNGGGNDYGGTDYGGTNDGGTNENGTNENGMNENGMNENGMNENGTNENGTNNGGGNDYGGTNNGGGTTDRGTTDRGARNRRDARPCVSTTSTSTPISQTSTSIIPTSITPTPGCIRLPKSLSSFIGGFKSSVNTQIDNYIDEHHLKITKYNKNNHFFQPNYHDHLIRDEEEYHRIKNYIIQNPLKWDDDSLKINHSVS